MPYLWHNFWNSGGDSVGGGRSQCIPSVQNLEVRNVFQYFSVCDSCSFALYSTSLCELLVMFSTTFKGDSVRWFYTDTPNLYTGCFVESCDLLEVCIHGKAAIEVQQVNPFALHYFAGGGSFFGLVLWMVYKACSPQHFLKSGCSEMDFDWFCFVAANWIPWC